MPLRTRSARRITASADRISPDMSRRPRLAWTPHVCGHPEIKSIDGPAQRFK
jgi:hypothetical protein